MTKTNQIMEIYKKPKTDLTQLFKDNEGILKKQASFYSKRYNLEWEEVYSQALEIFCETWSKWNPLKGTKFSSYLTIELQRLNYFCKKMNKSYTSASIDECLDSPFSTFQDLLNNLLSYTPEFSIEFLDSIETELSQEAGKVVLDLIQGNFQKEVKGNYNWFGVKALNRKFSWPSWKGKKVLDEIREWWLGFEQNYIFC